MALSTKERKGSGSPSKKSSKAKRPKIIADFGDQPVRAGYCRDVNGKLIGTYIYLQEEDQWLLDEFCTRWLETYSVNKNFMLAIDLETMGLNPVLPNIELLLHCISWNGKQGLVFEHHKFDLTLYKKVLSTIPLLNHNLKFDAKFWIKKMGVAPNLYWDTMTATQMGWAGCFPGIGKKFGLDNVVANILVDYKMAKETRNQFIGKPPLSGFTLEQIEYSARDAMLTYQLYHPQYNRLKNQGLLDNFLNVEMPLLEILSYTELEGVDIDVPALIKYYDEREVKLEELKERIQELIEEVPPEKRPKLPKSNKDGKYNVGSSTQLPSLLEMFSIKVPDTRAETLLAAKGQHDHEFLNLAVAYRETKTEISKQAKSWKEKWIWPETNKIYPTFFVHGAETGRLSAADPPIQQTTHQMRELIIAPPGWSIVSNDYSQYEFRGCAAYTEEQVLVDAYKERAVLLPHLEELCVKYGYLDPDDFCKKVTKGAVKVTDSERDLIVAFTLTDIHRRNAALVFGVDVSKITGTQRDVGKTLGYALLYGSQASNIQVQLAKNDIHYKLEECQGFYNTYFENVPKIKNFIQTVHSRVRDGGFVENWVGRKRFFSLPPKFQTARYKKELMDNQREAVNWFFQSTNAHCTKMSIIELSGLWENQYEPGERPRVIINMHDELVTVAPTKYAKDVSLQQKEVMIKHGAAAIRNLVPMEVSSSIGERWTK